MFNLPLDGVEPDGTYITIHRDIHGRLYSKLWDEDGTWLDQLGHFADLQSLLKEVALQYPHATYNKDSE